MVNTNENENLTRQGEDTESLFDLKTIFSLLIQNWYWVLASTILCLCIAAVYVRYSAPVYSASMKVLIKDSDQKRRSFNSMGLSEMGLLSNSNGFDNELEILCSASVSERVVKRLKLYVSYYLEGKVVNKELYKDNPVQVDLEEQFLDAIERPFTMTLTKRGDGVYLEGCFDELNPDEVTFRQDVKSLPANIQTPKGTLILQKNLLVLRTDSIAKKENLRFSVMERWNDGGKLFVTITPPKYVARIYAAKKLTATPTSKATTVASVTLLDSKTGRALDYLNELLTCYNEDANEDKNEVALKTEQFIADRLNSIKNELDQTEGAIEDYKKDNELINLANDASSVLKSTTDYRKELVEIQTQLLILKSLMDYMDAPENHLQIIPANMGLTNTPLVTPLISTITSYNELVLKRNRLLKGSSEDNPLVVQATDQLSDLWPTIRYNMGTIYRNMETQKASIQSEFDKFSGRISETPTQERVLTNIARHQNLQSELYLTLLQKREENFIQLYSTAAKARIIETPCVYGKVSPRTSIILLIALVIGFCLPLGIFMLRDFLRFKIGSREDVEKLTRLPILADIPLHKESKGNRQLVVRENYNGTMEEAFRGLRTNLKFVLKPAEKVVLVTSCIPGEGKSFVAANLAMSLALLGKKVLIVGLDIRKPRLVALFGLKPSKKGIVNFLCGEEPDYELLDSQVIPSTENKNLDILPAGIIPPNPAELLSGTMLQKAITHLSETYDYIVLDTPPVGLVADTLSIAAVANVCMFVTRINHSLKANFTLINDISRNDKMQNCNIILNGVELSKRGKYGYRYSYTYGGGKYGMYGDYNSETGSSYTTEK